MKPFIFILLLIPGLTYAQTNKEAGQPTESRISDLEARLQALENELSTIKTAINSTVTSLSLLLKSNTDLERKMEELKAKNSSLQQQYDSLRVLQITPGNTQSEQRLLSGYEKPPFTAADSIRQTIYYYLKGASIEARKKYIKDPEKTAVYMNTHYVDGVNPATTVDEIILQDSSYKIGQPFTVMVSYSRINSLGGISRYKTSFTCLKTGSGYKIDWEATVGYNKITLNAFKADINISEVTVRVEAVIGNYYNYNYIERQDDYINISISDSKNNFLNGCYVQRNSETGRKLYALLRDGNSREITIRIKKDLTEDKSGNTAVITRFLADNWQVNTN